MFSKMAEPMEDISPSLEKSNIVICIVDKSGSMGLRIETRGYENDGFTRLDLVKHTMRTIINSLPESTRLGIVEFSTDARISLPLNELTDNGKTYALDAVEKITEDSMTNLWSGIHKALDMIPEDETDTHIEFIILTDGESNNDPPRGVYDTLRDYVASMKIPTPRINTFGFGYDINSELLHKIASSYGGVFGFIPDCTMIGTVFVNYLANYISGVNNGDDPVEIQATDEDPITEQSQSSLVFKLEYESSRHRLVEYIHSILYRIPSTEIIDEIYRYFESLSESEWRSAVLSDLRDDPDDRGQIGKAVEKESWYKRWGQHYLRSLHIAHANKICLNFKDRALQFYSNSDFEEQQRRIERIFIDLPPPEPSSSTFGYGGAAGMTTPSTMASYYDITSGCFTGNTEILVSPYPTSSHEDWRYERMEFISPGDYVVTKDNIVTRVRYVIMTKVENPTIVHLSSTLGLTPYHPYRNHGTSTWWFPIQSHQETKEPTIGYVYNLVLEDGHIVKTREHECLTLGHGIQDDIIAKHEYFGTYRVIDDIERMLEKQGASPIHPSGSPSVSGYLVINNLIETRDEETNQVIGWDCE